MTPARAIPLLTLLLSAACGEAPRASSAEAGSAAASLRARTGTQLDVADLVKPRMDGDAELDPYLAPLVYLEADGDAAGGLPGAAVLDASGVLTADTTRPSVYFADEAVTLDGVTHRQLSFVWFRPGARHALPQGVRVTSDPGGQPAVIEVLDDSSGCRVVYTSERLAEDELASSAADGAPETPATSGAGPPLVVAGHFGVGPVPTGPYVYLAHDSNDVVAVHCRCEETQTNETRDLVEYELLPLQALEGLWPDAADDGHGFGPPQRAFEGLRRP